MIQLLNIAGLGPIFGAIAGALWGPVVYFWIVIGTIFSGAVHDYLSGMISLRHNGESISEIVGIYLGDTMKTVMRIFSVILLVLVGTVGALDDLACAVAFSACFSKFSALAWVLKDERMTSVIVGASSVKQLADNIYAIFGKI